MEHNPKNSKLKSGSKNWGRSNLGRDTPKVEEWIVFKNLNNRITDE